MTSSRVHTALATAAAGVAFLALAPAAQAAPDGPGRFDQMQVGVDYTVYRPTVTFGIARTDFQGYDCSTGGDEQLSVQYGRQGKGRWIQMLESAKGCGDGPDGVGPASTFMVDGVKATVMGDCPGQASTCTSATNAGVKRGAYVTVTMPGKSPWSSTFVEIYTAGLTTGQIRQFARGLEPAQ